MLLKLVEFEKSDNKARYKASFTSPKLYIPSTAVRLALSKFYKQGRIATMETLSKQIESFAGIDWKHRENCIYMGMP